MATLSARYVCRNTHSTLRYVATHSARYVCRKTHSTLRYSSLSGCVLLFWYTQHVSEQRTVGLCALEMCVARQGVGGWVCMHAHVYAYVCIHAHVCAYVCMCMCVRMYQYTRHKPVCVYEYTRHKGMYEYTRDSPWIAAIQGSEQLRSS